MKEMQGLCLWSAAVVRLQNATQTKIVMFSIDNLYETTPIKKERNNTHRPAH